MSSDPSKMFSVWDVLDSGKHLLLETVINYGHDMEALGTILVSKGIDSNVFRVGCSGQTFASRISNKLS